jgi:class I fructose-bisphosphate aldolase
LPTPTSWAWRPPSAQLPNLDFKHEGPDYHVAADFLGRTNCLAAAVGADITAQKQAETNAGYTAIGFGETNPLVHSELTSEYPVDLMRYQVANCYLAALA